VLSPFRGTTFRPAYLRQGGQQLGLVAVTLAPSLIARIPDCTDPAVLAELDLHAHAGAAGAAGALAGLRWWSALTGAWHTTVIFTDRQRAREITFGAPRHLEPDDDAILRALLVLGIRPSPRPGG